MIETIGVYVDVFCLKKKPNSGKSTLSKVNLLLERRIIEGRQIIKKNPEISK